MEPQARFEFTLHGIDFHEVSAPPLSRKGSKFVNENSDKSRPPFFSESVVEDGFAGTGCNVLVFLF